MLALAAAGCAHTVAAVGEPSLVAAYRDVRSGRVSHAEVGGYLFCGDGGGVEIYRTSGGGSADWADRMRDSWIRGSVRDVVARDGALADAQIVTNVERGEAQLRGHVTSDTQAVRAATDVLGIFGVVAVSAKLDSPQSVAAVAPSASCF